MDFDEGCWLLGGSTDDSVDSCDGDSLSFQFLFYLFFCDVGVDSFDDQDL